MSTLALSRPAVLSRPNRVKLSFAGLFVLAAALNGTSDEWVQAHGTAADGYDGLHELTAAESLACS